MTSKALVSLPKVSIMNREKMPVEYKIARLKEKTILKNTAANERAELYKAASNMFASFMNNPAAVVLTGVILTEYFQGHNENGRRVAGGGWMGSIVGTTLETSLGAYLLLQSSDKIISALKDVSQAIAPLIPTIAAAA